MKKHKIYPTLITSKKEAMESVKDFGLNLCKAADYLKSDKALVAQAVSDNPYAVRFADKQTAMEPEVQSALGSAKKKVEKFYLESLQNEIDFSKPLTKKDYSLLVMRNKNRYEKQQNTKLILSNPNETPVYIDYKNKDDDNQRSR